ncbi:HlyD family type I secretion periplasmic adaptor subunit [Novispirillum sp. DQ9]|uniref:HlyD family type I secretion periplasmic adaptor subunit n=1 Tax=Novispirillum sp. DQ9 TaxID=3398612 RepID=UPI003C7E6551
MRSSSLTVPAITIDADYHVVPATPYHRMRGLAWVGVALVAIFIGGFGTWAAVAPLESAAIAAGTVTAESSRKTVQHLEGGIIGEILVRDGDFVEAGQTLIRLADTRPRTSLASLNGQLWNAIAREARLIAERDGLDIVDYPWELLDKASDPVVAQVLAGQERIFNTRRALLHSRTALIEQRIARVREEIIGLKAQEQSANRQASLIRQEIADVRVLYDKGLARKPRLLALERALAEIQGHHGEFAAQIAQAQQVIAEAELNMITIQNDTQDEVATALRDTQVQISQLREQMEAARDVMTRTEIRAPEAGIVTDLRVRTSGGVIAPGQPLLDLVPAEDRLVVKARIRPDDIDMVREGLPAQVRLTPFKHRLVPPIDGRVRTVSADHLIDERTGQPYYEATIEISDAAMAYDGVGLRGQVSGLVGGPDLVPGMPAEVMIKTGESTVAVYALAPILDSFNRAFREN